VRIQGSEDFGQGVEQSLGGHAAKSVSGGGRCSVAATRERRLQLSRSRLTSNMKGASGRPRNHLSRCQRRAADLPHPPGRNRLAIGATATCLLRWLGPGLRVKQRLGQGLPPLSGAAPVLQHAARPAVEWQAVWNSVSRGGAATCVAARLKIHAVQIFTRISWKTMVKMSKPLTIATA
jgi:hypothetical protein